MPALQANRSVSYPKVGEIIGKKAWRLELSRAIWVPLDYSINTHLDTWTSLVSSGVKIHPEVSRDVRPEVFRTVQMCPDMSTHLDTSKHL